MKRSWRSAATVGVSALCLLLAGELGATPAMAGAPPFKPAPSSLQHQLANISKSVFDAVGVTSSATPLNPPFLISNQPPLTVGAKTVVFYFGAEFCPYCAAERWALAVALNRFGKLSNLGLLASSSADIYPSTPTFTFRNAKYTSRYVQFEPREYESASGTIFQKLTRLQTYLVTVYDSAPYIQDATPGQHPFPFVDVGDKALVSGASYTPGLLSGLTRNQIAAGLSDPRNPVTQGIVASANYLSAAICLAIASKAPVCSTKGVTEAAAALASHPVSA